MAGIDGITSEILQEAKKKAEALLDEARKKAEAEEAAVKKETEEMTAREAERTEKEARALSARIHSSAGLEQRKALLVARQEVIDSIIKQAYEKLDRQDDASYFAMIKKLLAGAVQPESGEILFSAKDLQRLPAGFENEISQIAADKGGNLTVSAVPASIDNGFILRYGGIEENCSLAALFSASRDRLQDKVHAALW